LSLPFDFPIRPGAVEQRESAPFFWAHSSELCTPEAIESDVVRFLETVSQKKKPKADFSRAAFACRKCATLITEKFGLPPPKDMVWVPSGRGIRYEKMKLARRGLLVFRSEGLCRILGVDPRLPLGIGGEKKIVNVQAKTEIHILCVPESAAFWQAVAAVNKDGQLLREKSKVLEVLSVVESEKPEKKVTPSKRLLKDVGQKVVEKKTKVRRTTTGTGLTTEKTEEEQKKTTPENSSSEVTFPMCLFPFPEELKQK